MDLLRACRHRGRVAAQPAHRQATGSQPVPQAIGGRQMVEQIGGSDKRRQEWRRFADGFIGWQVRQVAQLSERGLIAWDGLENSYAHSDIPPPPRLGLRRC
jgi:hypothetical protein